jgi:hypothetical protein
MLPLLISAVMQAQTAPREWFGPETVSFNVAFAGNPYDIEKSDMRVLFIDGKGRKTERLAYYDETEAAWKAVLLADHPGKYRPILLRNGKEMETQPEPDLIDIGTKPELPGFVRRDPADKLHFRYDDGSAYIPLGFNLGWQSSGLPDMPDMLRTMGRNGVNWSRIWACNWDGKNPWWPMDDTPPSDRMWPKAFERWDQLVGAAEDAGISFQFVLFHHGEFSTRVNPNFPDNPWNKAKGGFLEKAADFFTDPEAKRRAKMWLRYAVARWGHSTSVMAWELFNEVEWVDARYEDRWKDVLAWHKEMAEYVRSIDPYQHLVTTSSTFEFPNLYDSVDYYQPHTYPPDVRTAISTWKQPGDKPAFFGEFGPGVPDKKSQRADVRDGIWSGLLSGQAGGGSFWTWEVVDKEKLYNEWKIAHDIVEESQFKLKLNARPIPVRIQTSGTADLTFNPGTGWAKATQTKFVLQQGQKPEGLGGLPGFLQGPGHRDMFPEPLTFTFRAPKAGSFTMQLSQISKAGAKLRFKLNGKVVADKEFAGGASDAPTSEKVTVAYPAGSNEIEIEDYAGDWVVMKSFTFTGMDSEASAQGFGTVDWLMVRITANAGAEPTSATLSSFGLAAGTYTMTTYDLETGKSTQRSVSIPGITHTEKINLPSRDLVVVFKA